METADDVDSSGEPVGTEARPGGRTTEQACVHRICFSPSDSHGCGCQPAHVHHRRPARRRYRSRSVSTCASPGLTNAHTFYYYLNLEHRQLYDALKRQRSASASRSTSAISNGRRVIIISSTEKCCLITGRCIRLAPGFKYPRLMISYMLYFENPKSIAPPPRMRRNLLRGGRRPSASTRPHLSLGVSPTDRKSTRLNSSHSGESRMPSSA